MDLSNLMQMANQLREQLTQSQEEAAKTRVTGEAGGGMVRVVLNGTYEVQEVTIDPKVIDATDKGLLEDLVRAAFNQAASKVSETLRDRMGNFAQSFGLDLNNLGVPMGPGTDIDKKPDKP